ncbi:MAG: hypothetical protein LBT00_04295 [Spirochaetaceae bacterium]|nr:hypothetical protein [Spirochaetaceae bacterium]
MVSMLYRIVFFIRSYNHAGILGGTSSVWIASGYALAMTGGLRIDAKSLFRNPTDASLHRDPGALRGSYPRRGG